MLIPFGKWGPDQYGLNSELAGEAKGLLPSARGYEPWPALAETSAALTTTPCRGAFAARTSSGSTVIFAGSATKLYKFASVSSWTDVTRSSGGNYALGSDNYWSFAQFDDLIIAVNGVDDPQFIDVNSGTNFAALGGSPPVAKFVKVVGDVVLLMQLGSAQGAIASEGSIQVINSGFRDPDYWTVGKKSCDFDTFWNGGAVQGATNILAGLLFTQKTIQRMVQTQGKKLLAFAPVTEEIGTEAPHSIVTRGNEAFLYSTQGFIAAGQGGIRPIGNEWIDNWFLENVNSGRVAMTKGAFDPIKMRVFWLFASPTNETYYLDHILAYDIALDRWTHAEVTASYLFAAATPGQTLSDLTSAYGSLSAVPYPLGSPVWKGGAPSLAAFSEDDKLAFFAGDYLTGTAQTSRMQLIPGKRCQVNGWRPLTDAENATSRVAKAEKPTATDSWTSEGSMNPAGRVTRMSSGRYHKFELTVAAGEDWNDLQGVQLSDDGDDYLPDGED